MSKARDREPRISRSDDQERSNRSGPRAFGGSEAFAAQQARFTPPWRPPVDINQATDELIADVLAVGAAVEVYSMAHQPPPPQPKTRRRPPTKGEQLVEDEKGRYVPTRPAYVEPPPDPEAIWCVVVAGTKRVLWRWRTRDAAITWVTMVDLPLKGDAAPTDRRRAA